MSEMMQLPFPPSGNYLPAIRESTRKLCDTSKISIEAKNIEQLLQSDTFKASFGRVTTLPGVALPLNFASPLDELNVLSVLALLNFGSSYDAPFRSQTGHGASNAVRALIFSMYLTSNSSDGDLLSAQGMQSMHAAKVAEFMGVKLHVEKPHSTIPGVVLGELGGPLYPFVQFVTGLLNETGRILDEQGYPNLGVLVAETLKEGGDKAKSSEFPNAVAEAVIEKLAKALPGFRDMAVVHDEPVYFFSKVIFLLNVISIRFGSKSSPPFPIPEIAGLPISADGINSSVLIHLGIVNLVSNPTLAAVWPTDPATRLKLLNQAQHADATPPTPADQEEAEEGPTATRDQALLLRAAAVAACERFPEVAASETVAGDLPFKVTLPMVSIWFQTIIRDRLEYKALPSIVVKDDVFF